MKLYGGKIKLTASRADKLRTCKYAYFMQYGLRAKPRLKAGLDALESGSFLHYVLEGTAKYVMELGGFKAVPIEEIRKTADVMSDKYASEVLGGMTDKNARVRYLFQRLKRTAGRVAENVAEELRSSDFEPLGFELDFGENGAAPAVTAGEGPEEVELMGVVDRVDGWEKDGKIYIRVVDYKSGYKKFDLSDIWHGLGLQMLIYLFALEERGIEIYGRETVGAGVLYVPVKDAVYSGSRGMAEDKLREKTDEALRRSGLVLKIPDVVEAMESGKPKRFIPVTYARGSMDYSAASSLASLEQLGKLRQHVDMLLKQMGRALHEGRTEADPYYRDLRTSACSYCEFASACRFDESNGIDSMRYLYKVKQKDFWERLGAGEDAG
jgi:ATP-dependent helicase/nuclease subunit B